MCVFLCVLATDSPSALSTAVNGREWLVQHGCRMLTHPEGVILVEVPDLIDPDDAIEALRSIPDLEEIYFFAGEPSPPPRGFYFRTWDWRGDEAERVVSEYRSALPEVKLNFSPGAF